MTIREKTVKAAQDWRIVWPVLLSLCGGVVYATDAARNAQKVPDLEQIIVEQQRMNAVAQEQLKHSMNKDMEQDRRIEMMLQILLEERRRE